MKTCKEKNLFDDAKPAKEYPADWLVIPALDVGRYIRQNTVPLSEFEAYKNKVKQTIEERIKQEKNDLLDTIKLLQNNVWKLEEQKADAIEQRNIWENTNQKLMQENKQLKEEYARLDKRYIELRNEANELEHQRTTESNAHNYWQGEYLDLKDNLPCVLAEYGCQDCTWKELSDRQKKLDIEDAKEFLKNKKAKL